MSVSRTLDSLISTAIFSANGTEKQEARKEIFERAKQQGIFSSSMKPLYDAIGNRKESGFTVPAINIRTLTFDTARIIFRLMQKHSIGPLVFEIARSEIEYTHQRPQEYAVSVLAAAIKENHKGPVFLQGDHYQLSKTKFSADKSAEMQKIKDLIDESIAAQFYNIDIDASTLVDLDKEDLLEQQRNNFEVTAELTKYIREKQLHDVMISLGGEIGHIGGKNSTVEDFEAFMNGYVKLVTENGISKVSVQTGTSHGGIPLPDGTIADVKLDFEVLDSIGKVAKEKYGMGGAVEHGASTLPIELFDKFPKNNTVEIHLATEFQNIVYDTISQSLKEEVYDWVRANCADERKDGWTDDQFMYKTRKKALGPFKERLWTLSAREKEPTLKKLEQQLEALCEKLNVFETKEIIAKYIKS